ncbi:beta-lactamase-like protein [Blyttiomyces helicus]|uniref:Cleavage and polyadenylation specificity factor subunit 2 n=1 Tax=Blyttiomyces helicus TaxID=388810 RepID=A0A4P9W9H6_9FUNG|nr:beta-lactamase-like protein [Blyttiomyces helicus]|eukprot:RKO87450.1 beta-lactamase-like protein [Blyttiomyces helicus]
MKELEQVAGPKIVLASLSSLDTGFSAQLLHEWGLMPQNIVILPDRGSPGSMARRLYDRWVETAPPQVDGSARPSVALDMDVSLIMKKKIPLEGDELAEFLTREQQRKEAEAELLAKAPSMLQEDESDASEDEGEQGEVGSLLTAGFDVYVKDATRAGGFFKQSQSYRMFPISEPRKRVDDYGEIIDPAVYMRGQYQYTPAAAEEVDEVFSFLLITDMPSTDPRTPSVPHISIQGPTPMDLDKLKPEEDKVPSKVMYIDFEGRADGRSIKNILHEVNPRKLILIHGSEESTQDLANYCLQSENFTSEVFCPAVGECINVSAATNIYQVKLTDSLVSSLSMAHIDDYELAYVSGVIRDPSCAAPPSASSTTPSTLPTAPRAAPALSNLPILDILPLDRQAAHQPVIVGDLKLFEFRRLLTAEGFVSEFVKGALVVDGGVVVRRRDKGRVEIEGPIGKTYYGVRKLLYEQHAVL